MRRRFFKELLLCKLTVSLGCALRDVLASKGIELLRQRSGRDVVRVVLASDWRWQFRSESGRLQMLNSELIDHFLVVEHHGSDMRMWQSDFGESIRRLITQRGNEEGETIQLPVIPGRVDGR